MMENLSRFLTVPPPDGFMGFLVVIGFITSAILAVIFVVVIVAAIHALMKQRRARKLAAEVLINPEAAYRQILDQEELISKFDKESEAKKVEKRRRLVEELVKLQGEFTNNFKYVVQDDLRRQIEEKSSANR